MNVVVAWMYSSPEGESILHDQVGSASGSRKVQNYYWRCVFLLFESSARLNPGARHILFVNKRPPASIDGVDLRRLAEQYAVEVVEFTTLTKSSPDYYGAWNTQFLVLDVLDWLKEHVLPEDGVFLLDSDVVFHKPIGEDLVSALEANGALLYSIDYGEEQDVNGLTRSDLARIAREMNGDFPTGPFTYSGGEFICCLGSEVGRIAAAAREAYAACLERHARGAQKFNEEAHLLSYVYHLLGYPTHTGNRFIKRMWTDRSVYSNIDGTESDLVLWHLPAEKKRGFLKVFRSYREVDGRYELTARNFGQAYGVEETGLSRVRCYMRQIVRPAYRFLRGLSRRLR